MQFIPIKTRPPLPPQDNLFEVIDKYVTDLQEWDILFITSKVVAIHEWRCVKDDWNMNKKDFIKKEADYFIKTDVVPWHEIYLTLKNNILIASAWIDRSNSNWYFVFWPEKMQEFSKELHKTLTKKFNIKNLWIIITDSSSKPLKLWVQWIWIYSYGIVPLNDERWNKDIFWEKLKITQINVIDSLSSMAVFLMWEWSQTQPIVIWRNIPNIKYSLDETLYDKMVVSPDKDMYSILLKDFIKNK